MLHNWTQPGSFTDKTYNGKIEKQKITKKCNVYRICYWDHDENYEDNGEDSTINIHELATDYICGDLQLLS
ncbi:hypothetical protein SNE40_019825 [Patella caerulea]|uniref:Uncharacterized protein n=1 Tax=Patella caerulea TaxID=87958 RepID=A0AAN8IXY2_PATCE